MSDLISRSALIKHFETIQQQENVVGLEFVATIDEIKGQPTAYSVDKVVEELELHSFELGTDTLPVHYVRLNEAIEIVKQKCNYRDEKCVRVGHDCVYCNVVDMHLCDTCKKTYPECDGKNVKFGCDIDTYPNTRQNKDNIFYCDGYVKREKKKNKNKGGGVDDN